MSMQLSGGPILIIGTQSPAEELKCLVSKKNEIYLKNAWMNVFAKTKANESARQRSKTKFK